MEAIADRVGNALEGGMLEGTPGDLGGTAQPLRPKMEGSNGEPAGAVVASSSRPEDAFEDELNEKIKEETQCMICFDLIKNTRTVKECLHRFCSECIECAMRVNSKECPLCKTHIPSRRSLRDDFAFDKLIEAICGDPAKFREEQGKETEQWWAENKTSFKHIGEAYNKQKQANKGKRVYYGAHGTRKTPAGRASATGNPSGRQRGRPKRKAAQHAAAPALKTPADVEADYAEAMAREMQRADALLRARQLQESRISEVEGGTVLVTLKAMDSAYELPRPFLLVSGDVGLWDLAKFVSSKFTSLEVGEIEFLVTNAAILPMGLLLKDVARNCAYDSVTGLKLNFRKRPATSPEKTEDVPLAHNVHM